MNKKYDMLLPILIRMFKLIYFKDQREPMLILGACNVTPNVEDIEWTALVHSLFVLHLNGVPMKTDFPDLLELKSEIQEALVAFDKIRAKMKKYRAEHNATSFDGRTDEDKQLMNMLSKIDNLGEA